MEKFFQRFWTPLTGALSSLSFKGIIDVAANSNDIVSAAGQVAEEAAKHEPELITYLYIGMLGGLGGLLIKISWGCIKRVFPKLKNIDK